MESPEKPRQQIKAFFDHTPDRRFPRLPDAPSDDAVRKYLISPNCPLNEIIVSDQNRKNFESLQLMCFSVLRKWDRNPRGNNFGLYCPPGQGKTYMMKKVAATLRIIFVFVQSPSIDSNYTLFEAIRTECEQYGCPLVSHKSPKGCDFFLPPMLVFFDEAHKLPLAMMKGGLLNAMEPDDSVMAVHEPGHRGNSFTVDCHNVCWSAATTDRGDLFDAFEQRLLNPIQWSPATLKELPVMVKAGLDRKLKEKEIEVEVPMEVCEIIATYQKIPRLAIHHFGMKVAQRKQFCPIDSWQKVCQDVAELLDLDDGGLSKRQIEILRALGQRPIAEDRLGNICGCRTKELQKFDLPGLSQYYDGGPFIGTVSGRGVCITEGGLRQLEKRGISHKGERVTVEYFEKKR
jgi:Holliday junction resolvasome RuvABC ATP-dependent DNA helicase subunit